jgi:N,N'-diacetyllegionaminate synthase
MNTGTEMKPANILIGKKVIGPGSRVFVIAEIGLNHNGSLSQAIKLIDAAAESGADAVGFQSFRADGLLIPSRDRHPQRADIGDSLGVPLFKTASADITHVPLLRYVASKGKPILLSTGMSFLTEVVDAISNLKAAGAEEVLLMHCVSSHPVPPRDMNLRALQTLQSFFDLPVGLSDYSEGILLSLMAAALGAVIVEKHFTLDRTIPCPERKSSVDPTELKQLVKSLREVEESLGDGRKKPTDAEEKARLFERRSIVAAVDIRVGEIIAPWMLTCKRPGSGLEPNNWEKVMGRTARRNLCKDTILQWDDFVPSASPNSGNDDSSLEEEIMTLRAHAPGKRHD